MRVLPPSTAPTGSATYRGMATAVAPLIPAPARAAGDDAPAEPLPPRRRERLMSLDVFRGMTVAGMLLVNNPGTWAAIHEPLEHAPWHGWTPTDLIFPFFLFIVGVAIPLAFQRRVEAGGTQTDLEWKILKRSLLIFFRSEERRVGKECA